LNDKKHFGEAEIGTRGRVRSPEGIRRLGVLSAT
jgi:hypothetical protein